MSIHNLTVPQLVPVLVAAARDCLDLYGNAAKNLKWPANTHFVAIGSMEIAYHPADALVADGRLDSLYIWKDRKEVLMVKWDVTTPEIVKASKLRRGAWIDELLRAARERDVR